MERWPCGKPNPIKGEDTAVNVEDQNNISRGDSQQELQMDHLGHPLFLQSPSVRAEPVPQTLGHSDGFRLDEHLGVSQNVEEILDYWRLDPVCSPGGSKMGAGDPETLPAGNKTPAAMMGDVPVFTLASQMNMSNGGVTCEPCDVKKVPTETKCSALTSLHIRSKEKQQSESSKKSELDLSQCKSEIMSECPEMKVEDPIWSYYYQIESGMTPVKTKAIPVKKESLENATVAVKTKNEVDSEMKVEDPIWECYFAEQEKWVPNVERKTYAAHVKEEPGGTESPFSFTLGSSSLENAVQQTLTDRCDQDENGGLYAVKPAEEQSVKNSTETYYVKREMDIKNEDPIWANFHLNEVRKDLKPKYDNLALLPSMIENNHQPPIFKELLSLRTENRQPIHMVNVSVPAITGGQESTMTSDPKGCSQPISHQPSKKQRLESEPGDKSLASNSTPANTNQRSHHKPQQQDGSSDFYTSTQSHHTDISQSDLGSQSNTADHSLPMPGTGIKYLPQTSSIYNKHKPSTTATEIVSTCQLCGKSIASHKLSAEALKGLGQTDTTKPWTCCVCKATYKGQGTWGFHRQKHISGLKCLECGKCFKTQHSLEVHKKTHSKERPFSCEECGKTYRTLSLRNAHIYSCHKTPGHVCQECGKSFRQRTHLYIHMNIHTGNRPYQCADCEAAFKSPSALYTHKTIHTGKKPFVCPRCGMRFRLNAFLTVHLATHSTTKGKLHNKSGKSQSKREQSDSEETSDSLSDSDTLPDSTPQTPTSRETRSQRKPKQVEN
uniref:C2H2-type domain-containing protein n=1 Tax=Hucho hucho TaxID=62062 RepID=A0A4W5P9A3_9TELE